MKITKAQFKKLVESIIKEQNDNMSSLIFDYLYGGDPSVPFEWSDIKDYHQFDNIVFNQTIDKFKKAGLLSADEILDHSPYSIEDDPGTEFEINARDLFLNAFRNINGENLNSLVKLEGYSSLDDLIDEIEEEEED